MGLLLLRSSIFPLIFGFDGFKLTVFHSLKISIPVTVHLLVIFIIVLCGSVWRGPTVLGKARIYHKFRYLLYVNVFTYSHTGVLFLCLGATSIMLY